MTHPSKGMLRLRHIHTVLSATSKPTRIFYLACRSSSQDGEGVGIGKNRVRIGNAERQLKEARNPHLVPVAYLPAQPHQTVLQHLKWMLQKDNLGQDIFLIGPPGSFRRVLAMMYLEMTNRECEYVALSRDTTENDLKQRREIISGSAVYLDQSAVRAALHGRVLVLEGIEKAERNVLPVLNNLLENREMQLEDGRFLVAADRYDQLAQEHSSAELDKWRLIRCDPEFRVIALGLPVPRYAGNSLDPPLRSRFQARDVAATASFEEVLQSLHSRYERLEPSRVMHILSFAHAVGVAGEEDVGGPSGGLQLPDFPLDRLHVGLDILNAHPGLPDATLIDRLYPYRVLLKEEGTAAVSELLARFELAGKGAPDSSDAALRIDAVEGVAASPETERAFGTRYRVELSTPGSDPVGLEVPGGSLPARPDPPDFVETASARAELAHMLLSHGAGADLCLVGPRGCGKSALAEAFARRLRYRLTPVLLHPEMTARDLLQQRATLPSGDTAWRLSPVVEAALDGRLLLLDGLHRLNPATFSVLHRLLIDREADLFDGRRLVRADRFEMLRRRHGWSEPEMAERGILRVHPAFRVLALAEPPPPDGGPWLSADALTAFLFHPLSAMSLEEERQVLRRALAIDGGPVEPRLAEAMETLLGFVHRLRGSDHPDSDTALAPLAKHLSTRQLVRVARRMARYPEAADQLGAAIHKACLYRFLPRLTQRALDEAMEAAGIAVPTEHGDTAGPVVCEQKDGVLRVGSAELALEAEARHAVKIPDVRFYDNAEQLRLMEAMMQDFLLGEHLLLIGNQGVGKNKVADRLLHLMRRPREYMQLHRDTTVHALSLQPSLAEGGIVYEDSPLVRAARLGHLLVIDEADKAPTQVTGILKTLVETGQMRLSDGRRIVPSDYVPEAGEDPAELLVSHPDFRLWVLANRPGFPFLGNDFFAALGDLFSCHAVDNPPLDSEVALLRRYGPSLPEATLLRLVHAFAELRSLADEGQLQYPYSTRELVSIVRHLEAFPHEGLASVVRNVFDFDAYSPETRATLVEVLHRHGVPVGASPTNVRLAPDMPLPPLRCIHEWEVAPPRFGASATLQLSADVRPVVIRGPVVLERTEERLEGRQARSTHFSEETGALKLGVDEYGAVADVAVTPRHLHALCVNPVALHTVAWRPGGVLASSASVIQLGDVFPPVGAAFRPRFRLAPLGGEEGQETLLVHEEVTNILLRVDAAEGRLWRLEGGTGSPLPERALRRTAGLWPRSGADAHVDTFKMASAWSCPGADPGEAPDADAEPFVAFHRHRGTELVLLFPGRGEVHALSLPFAVSALHLLSPLTWLLESPDSAGTARYLLTRADPGASVYSLQPITGEGQASAPFQHVLGASLPQDTSEGRQKTSEERPETSGGRPTLRADCLAAVLVGGHSGTIRLFAAPLTGTTGDLEAALLVPQRHAHVFLPAEGLLVRGVPGDRVPDESANSETAEYLEVADLRAGRLRYLPAAKRGAAPAQASWLRTSCPPLFVRPGPDSDLVTVDQGGNVRTWQVAPGRLQAALEAWKKMLESGDGRLTLQRETDWEKFLDKLDQVDPKIGKFDPTGMPHVGGGMWAGGTGGMGTAGLGGVGGPFRLDAGHDVHQVPDEVKQAVPEHVRAAARDVALKMWRKRLKEIEMSEYDGEMYERYLSKVKQQVNAMRMVLDTLQAKGKERQWLKNKTEGELDDNKLVEGLLGEKSIYRRRGEKEPEPGTPQQKPKLLRVVADVSGSMYRFNGHDGRMERQLESLLMLMEAIQGYEQRLKYEIFGHSGEGPAWPFVKSDKLPTNNKERLNTLMSLLAHSQFCMSGDHTLEAVKEGIASLKAVEDVDERFLIILSDANLDRYGIHPQSLGRLLTSEPKVNCYAIFIGTLGNQAQWLSRSLPAGHSFVCLDNKMLPQIMQQIFASTILST